MSHSPPTPRTTVFAAGTLRTRPGTGTPVDLTSSPLTVGRHSVSPSRLRTASRRLLYNHIAVTLLGVALVIGVLCCVLTGGALVAGVIIAALCLAGTWWFGQSALLLLLLPATADQPRTLLLARVPASEKTALAKLLP